MRRLMMLALAVILAPPMVSAAGLNTPPAEPEPAWKLAAAADFDGDSRADLLWRQEETGITYLHMSTGAHGRTAAQADWTWTIIAAADVTGDGKADVLWTDGAIVFAWAMDGRALVGAGPLTPHP